MEEDGGGEGAGGGRGVDAGRDRAGVEPGPPR